MTAYSDSDVVFVVSSRLTKRRFTNFKKALALASTQAFDSEKTTSVFVYDKKVNIDVVEPIAVIYVKVTHSLWR